MNTPLAVGLLVADLAAIVAVVCFVLRDVARHRAAATVLVAAPVEPRQSAYPTMPAAQTVLPGSWFAPPTHLLPAPRWSDNRQVGRGSGALAGP